LREHYKRERKHGEELDMKRRGWILWAAAVLLAACTRATPEQQIVNDAAAALGGRDRILALKTLVIEGEGTNGNLGQDMTPEATSQTFTVTGYKRAIDLAGGRVRIEQTRTPNFTYFQGQAPQKQILGLDGDVAYNVAANGTATRAANSVASDRRGEFYHHPITIVRAALDPAATLANVHTLGNQRSVDVTTANGRTFTLAIDSVTKLPTLVVSMADNTNLGDVAIETSFGGYQDIGGVKLPSTLKTTTDKYTTAELRVVKQSVDAEAGDLAAPQAAASATPIVGVPAATVSVQELAKGVWFLAGQSHHSVLVEFGNHLALIEAPQNDTRTLAVIAKARELVPDKPLTHVINTHHHFDHSGGIRAAVSEGLTVITLKANAAFYQDAVSRPHTIVPDALARSPKPLKIYPVGEWEVLLDGGMRVELYPIQGSAHADTLLMAYFPRERLLVEADVFSPGGTVAPYAANLLDNIRKRNLRVDRIVPIHSTVTPFAELVKTVAALKTN
jgi:glyoxylase-like metal-dependent hydrolase (beta-lactamase superfamily II)